MAYVFAEGGYGAAATVIHTDPSHPDIISVSDAELLSSGTFHRIGADLHLNGHGGQHVVIPGYFASEHPPALVGPDGGRLNADLVAQLAGHEQLAAAQPVTANDATPLHAPRTRLTISASSSGAMSCTGPMCWTVMCMYPGTTGASPGWPVSSA